MQNRRQQHLSYIYAWFLVFVTPFAVPLAVITAWQGKVTKIDILCAFTMYCISGLGITLGYHRLVTHRAFQAKPWLRKILLIAGSFAMQGSPASWASLHIQHHRFADKQHDPHSPHQKGFWHAHCGWIFHGYKPDFRRFGKWLPKDPEVKHVSKYYLYYSNLGLLIPWLLCGWMGLLWAGLLRLFLTCHMTWSINSICHRFGKRAYTGTADQSTNHFLIALLTFGEGWHNNHHRHLQMPFLGHRWFEIDMGKWALLILQKCGWVWDLKIPKHFTSYEKSNSTL
ncbi:MAG: hypothetical protein BGO43_00885 [Gammaproteobacteria bacterium 39-13]|nr:fatty acid desaturase [Gammaproteobacteria bacterium]OJV86920.1 MAG: hypothetical protein BGO43_00885 [Gammaproteobacteria bacterium 39-13]